MESTLNKLAVALVTATILFGLVLAPVMAGAIAQVTAEEPVLIQFDNGPADLLADPLVGGRSGA
ncbi:MAG: hypothetical protein PVI59_17900 [Anaerolineae bacterium]|jgi:hypothetical protein